MPEGHTIHRLARDQTQRFVGQRLVVSSPQGRFAEGAESLTNKTLRSIEAHGKHLFYSFGRDRCLHVHLGLYGKFRLHQGVAPEPRGAVRLRLAGPIHTLDLNGPNQCEVIEEQQLIKLKSRLGQDPLRADADRELVWNRIRGSKRALGAVLLDQSIMAGIGNIYRAEILFLLKLHPSRACCSIERGQFDELWQLAKTLLQIGVRYNRIITTPREEGGKPLSRLRADERLLVYKKDQCPTCEALVASWLLANRTIYACPTCQT